MIAGVQVCPYWHDHPASDWSYDDCVAAYENEAANLRLEMLLAAGSIPQPGSNPGPCADPCEHRDCAGMRKLAETVCGICGARIGYDTLFYQDKNWTVLTHALCAEKEAEK